MKSNRGRIIGARLVCLRDYLLANASPTRAVRIDDMMTHLRNQGYEVAIKAVYGDLATLQLPEFGLELEYNAKKRGYVLNNPPYAPHELRLIVDSVQASKFITQEQARIITGKIKKLADPETRASLNRTAYVADRVRSQNESVVKDASKLYRAIEAGKKVGFRYFHYTADKKNDRTYSKDGNQLIVSPFAMLWNKGNLYLYAYDGKKYRYYRVDRMERISAPLTEERNGVRLYDAKSITRQKAKVFDMYSGKEYQVKLRFHNRLAGAVIDEFGKEVWMTAADDEHFTISVPVEVSPPFYAWVATFGHGVKILGPQEVQEGMRKFLQDAQDMLKDEGNV